MTANDWAVAQRTFHEAYQRGQRSATRQRVHWRVIPAGSVPQSGQPVVRAALTLGWALRRLITRENLSEQDLLALWPADAPTRTTAELVFEFEGDPGPQEGDGVIVGEFRPNGALCVVADDGRTLWPTYNPRPPTRRVPQR